MKQFNFTLCAKVGMDLQNTFCYPTLSHSWVKGSSKSFQPFIINVTKSFSHTNNTVQYVQTLHKTLLYLAALNLAEILALDYYFGIEMDFSFV